MNATGKARKCEHWQWIGAASGTNCRAHPLLRFLHHLHRSSLPRSNIVVAHSSSRSVNRTGWGICSHLVLRGFASKLPIRPGRVCAGDPTVSRKVGPVECAPKSRRLRSSQHHLCLDFLHQAVEEGGERQGERGVFLSCLRHKLRQPTACASFRHNPR